MLEISNDVDPADAASEWIEENEDKVDEWIDGVDEVDGGDIELVYVEWDTEVGSTNVIGKVLEDLGYNVTLRSEEHTSELQSRFDLVCRLLLDKKKHHERKSVMEY